jgi:uncharacterized membrane protein
MPTRRSDYAQARASDARERLRQSLFTGLAITVPLLITLLVISLVYGFVFGSLGPLVTVLERTLPIEGEPPTIVLQIAAGAIVVGLIWLVGFIAERRPSEGGIEERFDQAMGNVPGIGGVYRTFDEMSEMVLDTDTESFEEVKLVPFPSQSSYALGFVTAEPPEHFERATGNEDMLTLYVPMSPNPVMGGYVLYVPAEHCVDVDLSVEEGVKSIMTSGVAIGDQPSESTAGRTTGPTE